MQYAMEKAGGRTAGDGVRRGMHALVVLFAFLFCLALASPVLAADDGKPVDLNGMRITVLKPWTLTTTDSDGAKLKEGLGIMLATEGEIPGEGWATVYPAKKEHLLPTPEQLKGMNAKELGAVVLGLQKNYTEFPDEKEAEVATLTEVNGFTAILCKWVDPDEENPGQGMHNLTYYFFLKNKLVTLAAGVHGDKAAGQLLERICASFVPDTSAGK